MDWPEIRAAVEEYFKSVWIRTPVAWDNLTFDPQGEDPEEESGGATLPDAKDGWVRMFILEAGSDREVMTGSPDTGQKFVGVLMVQIFTPANTGSGDAYAIGKDLTRLFREKRIAVVESGGPTQQAVFDSKVDSAKGEDPVWFQLNWTCGFEVQT